MSIEVKVPELPESISEATVGAWHKKQGDAVDRDENILDLETDKVMLEVPAVASGVLAEIRAKEGDTVKTGDVLAVLEEGKSGKAPAKDDEDDDDEQQDKQASSSAKGKAEAASGQDDDDEPTPSPAARKLIDEHGLDIQRIKGTGKDGRITKSDVLEAVEDKDGAGDDAAKDTNVSAKEKAPPTESESEADESFETADRAAISSAASGGDRPEERVAMTRIRARIAERLLDASQNTAMLTTFNEIDMKAVRDARERYKTEFEKDHQVRLGYMSFFVKSVIEALKRYPIVNASIDENDVIYHGYYDIGIAVSSPRGLLVPVLRDADQMSYAEIEDALRQLGKRAKDGKITMEDLTGGTFTITNGGVFGSMLSTPILNPPQSAILGMHNIVDRAVVVDGEIVVRPMMYVALSYDHRLIDGSGAVMFLRTIKELIEDPARLLLQI